LDLKHLQALIGIADHGSFSAAAVAIGTVQSNVSPTWPDSSANSTSSSSSVPRAGSPPRAWWWLAVAGA